jgi:hypothetical protein
MTPRLASERESLERSLARTTRARLVESDAEGRRYLVSFDVRTLVRLGDGTIGAERREVPVLYLLAAAHPVVPPLAVAQAWDLFHPHVADPTASPAGAAVVCLGRFRMHDRLGGWIVATWDVLRFARLGLDHPLNERAAAWVRRELAVPGRFPTDDRAFHDAPARAAGGAP